MEVDAALLSCYPVFWDGLVLVCLVDDLGDDLGPEVYEGGVRGRDVRAADGVCRGIFEEEGEEGEDRADEEGDDDEVDEQEDEDTASHGEEQRSIDRAQHSSNSIDSSNCREQRQCN